MSWSSTGKKAAMYEKTPKDDGFAVQKGDVASTFATESLCGGRQVTWEC